MQKNINVNLAEMETCRCKKCGCPYFENLNIIKKIPGIMAGAAGGTIYQPVAVMLCAKCKAPQEVTNAPILLPGLPVPGKMEEFSEEATYSPVSSPPRPPLDLSGMKAE